MSSIHSRLSRGTTILDSRLHTVMTVCLVAMLSYGATKLGIAMIVPPHHLSPFWPTNALLLAVLLLVPRRVWPVLLVTAYVIVGLLDLQYGNSIISASWIQLGNVVEVLVAVSLVSYLFGGTPQLNGSKALVQYWFAIILASIVAAFVGALALQGDYWLHWRLWFLSDSFPLLTLTPAVLGWVQQGSTWARKSRVYYLEAVVPFTVLVLIGYLTLAAPGQGSSPALLYSLVPFLLWSALRFGLTGTATAMIVIAAMSIWGAIHGRGPFAEPGQLDRILRLQLFLLVATAPFMFLAVLVEERKQAEEKLKASEEHSRQLVKSSSVAMIVSRGLEERVELMNDRFTALFGYTMDDVPDVAHWWPLAYPDDAYRQAVRTEWQARVERAISNGTDIEPMEVTVRCKDGSTRYVEAHLSRMGDTNLVTLIDLTERKRAEEALRGGEERIRLAVQAGKMYAFEWDTSTDKVVRSAECMDILGKDEPTQTTRRELMARVHPDDREQAAASFLKVTPQSPNSQISYRVLGLDGRTIWVEKSARAFFDQDGRMLRMIGVIADITARKQAEETARESERRYRRIVETTNEGVWLLDSKLHTVFVNRQLAEMLGYDPVEIVGRSVFDFYFPEDVDRKRQRLERRRQGLRENFDDRLRRRDGSELWVRLAGIPVFKDSGEFDGALAMVSDITERRRAEEALRESEGRFRLVANTAPVLIWMSGTDKLCNYVNQPWLEFTGRPVETELGNGWSEGVHPEDLVACMDVYTQAFDRRESFQMEYRLRRHDGEYRWLLDIGVPRFNADQSFAGYIGSCIDVTDRKLAEESLASVGRKLIEAHEEERTWIARELHDDVNQRMALLAIELERWNQQLPPSAVEFHDHIHHASQRLSGIANDIQALSHRLHSSKLEYLGLVAAAKSFCQEFSEQQKVEIDFSHSDVPRTVPKEVSLSLFRVLQEALQNAVKHSGVRHIKVELRGTPEEIRLTVTDSGIGFDWRDAMRGRGLGLISMRERMLLVSGEISIKSQTGSGTTIHARVPFNSSRDSVRATG